MPPLPAASAGPAASSAYHTELTQSMMAKSYFIIIYYLREFVKGKLFIYVRKLFIYVRKQAVFYVRKLLICAWDMVS